MTFISALRQLEASPSLIDFQEDTAMVCSTNLPAALPKLLIGPLSGSCSRGARRAARGRALHSKTSRSSSSVPRHFKTLTHLPALIPISKAQPQLTTLPVTSPRWQQQHRAAACSFRAAPRGNRQLSRAVDAMRPNNSTETRLLPLTVGQHSLVAALVLGTLQSKTADLA